MTNGTLLADIRYVLRQMRLSAGFSVTAIVTLALTVGLAATVFSVFDAVLVRPLPFGHPDRLMMVRTLAPEGYTQPASWAEYKFWRDGGAAVADFAALSESSANLQVGNEPAPVRILGVTTNFFRVLDVPPLFGRAFADSEGEHGNSDVAVLSYGLWKSRFGGEAKVLGSKVEVNGAPVTVIGVMPADVRYPLNAREQIFVPMPKLPSFSMYKDEAGYHWLPTMARLKPGVSRGQAEAAMHTVLLNYAKAHTDDPSLPNRRLNLVPIAESLLGEVRGLVHTLTLAVLAILLLGCINVAGLMLARGLRRERDLVLRTALGASRSVLIRQLSIEIALLAIAGTVGGSLLSAALIAVTKTLLAASFERGSEVHLNIAVFGVSLVAALVTLAIAGLLPLRQIFAVEPASALRSGTQASGSSRSRKRLRAIFLGGQVTLATLLLTTSAVLLMTLHTMQTTPLGFQTDHLLTEDINLTPTRADAQYPYSHYYRPLIDKLQHTPGVENATIINMIPVEDYGSNSEITIEGMPPAPKGMETLAEGRLISPEFFQTMGAHIVRGRLPDDNLDNATATNVFVNEAFVRKFFPHGEDPVGRKIANEGGLTIAGVVSNMRQDLTQPALAEFDIPAAELPAKHSAEMLQEMHLIVRTKLPPNQMRSTLRAAMTSIDPTVPFRPALTMDDVMDQVLTMQRMESWLFGSFAALSLLLALVGLYGLVSQEVEQGRRDIGIRMALGAVRERVLGETLLRVATVASCGLVAGLGLSFMSRRVLESMLPVHATHQWLMYLALAAVMELLAVWAAWAPARRAASVNPVAVLRAE